MSKSAELLITYSKVIFNQVKYWLVIITLFRVISNWEVRTRCSVTYYLTKV